MHRVVIATANPGKLREFVALLAHRGFEVLPQSDFGVVSPEETADTFAGNALIKARAAARASGLPAIADDSGLEVDALGGRPGVRSARYAGPGASDRDNNALLLAELAGVPDAGRAARYRCVVAWVRDADDPSPLFGEASWEGRIGTEERGTGGFGYDPLFIVAGTTRTAAQMSAEEKNRASHRARALAALVDALAATAPP